MKHEEAREADRVPITAIANPLYAGPNVDIVFAAPDVPRRDLHTIHGNA